MNKNLAFCLISLAVSVAFSAQAGTLLPPGAADQSPSRLQAAPAPVGEFERQPVAFAWALDPEAVLDAQAPFLAESREFWAVAQASELQAGLAIDTTAAGAVIRISPAQGSRAVDPDQVRMFKNGRLIPEPQSFQRKTNAAQLKAAGMDVPDGSAIVQLAKEQGQGRFQVQMTDAKGRYLVHVYEPESPFVFRAQADRSRVLAGDTLEVAAAMQRGDDTLALANNQVAGVLVSPSGRSYDLAFSSGRARLQLPDDAGSEPGLWEVQLSAGTFADGASVQRDANTAVEVTRPTAKLDGGYGFNAAAVRFDLPVQVAAPGRYELRGTLYATAPDGVSRPVSQAHMANWLEPGQRQLALAFGRVNVPMGYGAPYELRFLELKDQSRMGTLDTRELALREGQAPRRAIAPAPAMPVRGVAPRQR
ncbi:MAG: DUF4785 family protein [Arenimonas sp.]|uniref:DUF4785 domain-containing protein n=1 Tax=Arenimonas sp. TaxID=1872635 RepID=UPI0025C689EA|nr:DUF4785 domain-containing protein [Arenimonas sp.]MBW8368624.1 DUF4785 family protein [Arenimonas sp.]